ncbi:hypothetical protein G4H71_04080 [Rhodococcus triatomae]|uniref:Condensation domain-containing protein n=1 Tax=Rhodococcus triatomae TaxID=300028 RepID=A0A1G7ZKR3_9NOCA|nr:hypothetical protein [Rhodococcus triatomae]QNG18013.1 hypothetical protein G4H72_03960 [Rhodococcus triatomae]QNG22318.1 hypothetical protein G4H71_04080 [Rhodococcus triatomae]SDH09274.1 hypothetical protein SAMN05444695_101142 [Rhodococcus triatomae]
MSGNPSAPSLRPRTRGRSVRVSPLDVMHAGARVRSVIGPVDPVDPAAAAGRVADLAALGPRTRVGLAPDRTTTRWTFDPGAPGVEFETVPEPATAAELLASLVDSPSGAPIRVVSAGRFLATEHDHGLGEVEFALALHETILGVGAPRPGTRLRPPVAATAFGVFARHPRRAAALLAGRGAPESAGAEPEARGVPAGTGAVGPQVAWSPKPDVFTVVMPADVVTALRARRDRDEPGTSLFAHLTAATYRMLAGTLDVHPTVTIPFDCRRYLRHEANLWGNFVAGLQFEVPRDVSARRLHGLIGGAAASGRPVANVLLGSGKARLALARGGVPPAPCTVPTRPRARLLFSHMGVVPRTDRGDTGLEPADYLAHSDPGGPEGVTVSSTSVAGCLQTTVSFHGNVFSREVMEAAFGRFYANPLGE